MIQLHEEQERQIIEINEELKINGINILNVAITDPSSLQVRLDTNNEKIFIFSEVMLQPNGEQIIKTEVVDLMEVAEEHSEEDIILAYHSSIDEFEYDLRGNTRNQLLAEYYFETYC